MIEREVEVAAPDGTMPTFLFHPSHEGPHPVVLFLMDAPGIRQGLKDMASRLASAGYYVMLPHLFYRGGAIREFGFTDEELRARGEMMARVNPTNIVGDAQALLAIAADDPAARDGAVGVVGYCMGGPLAVSLAKALPEQVRAAASIHGAHLATDAADSPHRDIAATNAELYFAWVVGDEHAPREQFDAISAAMDDAGVTYTVDWITNAVHGFAPPGHRYDREASELHWERVHSLFRRNLAD